MDINDATRIKNIPCQKLNALSGILGSSLLAFICIKVNRVEAVAVVATHAVIRPTPQMTWPATKSAGAGEDMSKIKPARKVMVAEISKDRQGESGHIIICMDNLTNNGRCRSEQSYTNKAKREYDRSGDESAGVHSIVKDKKSITETKEGH